MKHKDEIDEQIDELAEDRLVDLYGSPGVYPMTALDESDLEQFVVDVKILFDELEKRQLPIKLKKEIQRH